MRKGFTLLELLAVISIMGVLGTISVGGYRQMQRGIEERGAIQSANQFIRGAYQRAQVDRQPVQVYFWNEYIRVEDKEEVSGPKVIVGRAVAVRQGGRISKVKGDLLIDEFGDLAAYRSVVDEDESTQATESQIKNDADMYLYNMKKATQGSTEFERSVVKQSVFFDDKDKEEIYIAQNDQWENKTFPAYAFVISENDGNGGSGSWHVGDPYGFEFAQIQLAHNYIFETDIPKDFNTPTKPVVMTFLPGDRNASDKIEIASLRPNESGELVAQKVADTESPTKDLNN